MGAVAAVAALSLSVGLGSATAEHNNNDDGKRANTYIENDCKRLTQKPRHIELACGQSRRNQDDVELRKVRYRNKQYGKNNVRARARLHVEGVSGKNKVKLRFKNKKNCARKGKGSADRNDPVYKKVTIKFTGGQPAGLKKRYNERLGCG
ncbi:MAG: hypothetical protein H0U42_02715 [Thermoleophilaceae bacterium]|nr:hypothetical protein [Thermoleophilaceae bacterium]